MLLAGTKAKLPQKGVLPLRVTKIFSNKYELMLRLQNIQEKWTSVNDSCQA